MNTKKKHTIAALSTESGEFVEMVIANTARCIGSVGIGHVLIFLTLFSRYPCDETVSLRETLFIRFS